MPAALPRRVWAIGKGEYMDSWKTKHLFPAMGMIPVDRSGGDAAQAALDAAAEVLEQGRLFMIYPEGTRSRSGNLHKGRTGAARLALRCDAPIIPTGHEGTVEVQPPDTFLMKPRKQVVVRFGAPMWAKDYGDPDDPRTLRRFTDAVMFEIAQLSGQKYVDTYAGKDDRPADETKPSAPAAADEQQSVTPRRPSVVGSTAPTRPSASPSVHPNVPAGDGPPLIRPPSERPSIPSRRTASQEDGADEVDRIGVPPGRRVQRAGRQGAHAVLIRRRPLRASIANRHRPATLGVVQWRSMADDALIAGAAAPAGTRRIRSAPVLDAIWVLLVAARRSWCRRSLR